MNVDEIRRIRYDSTTRPAKTVTQSSSYLFITMSAQLFCTKLKLNDLSPSIVH